MEREEGAGASRPLLVIVSGAPASGKTTLARKIARELRLPLLSRDAFKESMLDVLGAPDMGSSGRIGAASCGVLAVAREALLDAGSGMVLESNFRRGYSEPEFVESLTRARGMLVHCQTAAAEISRRFQARVQGRDRHVGHFDDDPARLVQLDDELARGLYQPMKLRIPTIVVDTTNGLSPTLEAILGWITCQPDTVART